MPISTLGMMCLACVGMSEAPANITGLSNGAPAMIQLANTDYRPGTYNVNGALLTYTPKGNAVRLKPLSVRKNSTYKYSLWVDDLRYLQNQLTSMKNAGDKNTQAKNRFEHLTWYLWQHASSGIKTSQSLAHFKQTSNRDLGNIDDDYALYEALYTALKITNGYKGNRT